MIEKAILVCFISLALIAAMPPVAKSLDRVFAGAAFHLRGGAGGHHG